MSTSPKRGANEPATLIDLCLDIRNVGGATYQDGVDACIKIIREYESLHPAPAVPQGYAIVPVKITPAMIEAGMEAHYGKRFVRQVGGAGGISMTVRGIDYNGIDAMRNFWRGALAVAPEVRAPKSNPKN